MSDLMTRAEVELVLNDAWRPSDVKRLARTALAWADKADAFDFIAEGREALLVVHEAQKDHKPDYMRWWFSSRRGNENQIVCDLLAAVRAAREGK